MAESCKHDNGTIVSTVGWLELTKCAECGKVLEKLDTRE